MRDIEEILIIGGGGMVGQKLAHALVQAPLTPDTTSALTLMDLGFPPESPMGARQIIANVSDPAPLKAALAERPAVIFHFAAIVSGQAEADFDLGWEVNHMAFWRFLETVRHEHIASGGSYCPRVVFTSSIAVFGGPYPEVIDDGFPPAPLTSYGAQKAACELMLADFSRKGFLDGIAIRLPTICVRPGKPNKAASGFFSGIIREPLNGQDAVLPVGTDVRHWHASPASAVGFLRHAARLDTGQLGQRRALNLPGVSCTVEEQIEALRDVAGNDVLALIKPQPDPTIEAIVAGWPRNFAPERALALGFTADADFRSIIEAYIRDDLAPEQAQRLRLR
ncbi:D-erythronate dehydrogenase [Pseudoruegeria sp. SHC-113]|uniref:D-erythronate dehydrogenase n=1 Tax=Pseudoruegeria sp. SHC-113 TaxID=2855439 RepID=UPI0021BAF086|nr:D-erythronate dehydrogenase [Pseudoruegeria sp. SHC-113]